MKSKKRRKNEKAYLDDNAILLKCKYCSVFKTCNRKDNKLNDEKKKIRTFCLLTPNKSKKTLGKLTSFTSKTK